MGLRLQLAVSCAVAACPARSEEAGALRTQYLQSESAYRVGIAAHLPTTIVFPAPGLGFQGVGLMQASDTVPQPVQIEHSPGSHYFTVRAIMPQARSDLNVIFEGHIYAFTFFLSETPLRGLTLQRPPAAALRPAARRATRVDVARLLAMLDEAKAYDVIAGAFPGYQRNITVQEKGYRIAYPLCEILVDHAWRFEAEDTVVVRVVFLNKTGRPLSYRPESVALKIGERTFQCSIADANGQIPAIIHGLERETEQAALRQQLAAPGIKAPDAARARTRLEEIAAAFKRGQAIAYFAITGNPDGTRANVSLRNNFNVLVDVQETGTAAPEEAHSP